VCYTRSLRTSAACDTLGAHSGDTNVFNAVLYSNRAACYEQLSDFVLMLRVRASHHTRTQLAHIESGVSGVCGVCGVWWSHAVGYDGKRGNLPRAPRHVSDAPNEVLTRMRCDAAMCGCGCCPNQDAQACVKANPRFAKGYLRLVVALTQRKRHEDALQAAQQGLQVATTHDDQARHTAALKAAVASTSAAVQAHAAPRSSVPPPALRQPLQPSCKANLTSEPAAATAAAAAAAASPVRSAKPPVDVQNKLKDLASLMQSPQASAPPPTVQDKLKNLAALMAQSQ